METTIKNQIFLYFLKENFLCCYLLCEITLSTLLPFYMNICYSFLGLFLSFFMVDPPYYHNWQCSSQNCLTFSVKCMSKQYYLVMLFIMKGEFYWNKRLGEWCCFLLISPVCWPLTFRCLSFCILKHEKNVDSDILLLKLLVLSCL